MRRLLPIISLLLLVFNGCYDSHNGSQIGNSEMAPNCTISNLRQLCQDGCCIVNSDVVCLGRVTSSDREGNFYRTLLIEDATGGAEVLTGTYNIASQYPIGLQVTLLLKGCAIMLDNGVIQIGLPPLSFDSSPREFEAQEVIDQHILRSSSVEPMSPISCDVASLNETLCGRFVKVCGLTPSPLEGYEELEYKRLIDGDGNAIFLYISQFSDFYTLEIPQTTISLQGILYHESVGMNIGKQFIIKPRSKDDISITDCSL